MGKQKFGVDKIKQDRFEMWLIGVLPLSFLFGIVGFGLWTFWHLLRLADEMEEANKPISNELKEMYDRKLIYEINKIELATKIIFRISKMVNVGLI